MVPFLVIKAPKQFPYADVPPHQKGTVFQNSALTAPFSKKRLKIVPSRKRALFSLQKKVENGAPFFKGVPLDKGDRFRRKKR